MPSTFVKKKLEYPTKTIERAETALSCSPFHLKLFQEMRNHSVPISAIANQRGVSQGYAKKILSEAKAEAELVWSIEVGILRREVDGQGLTDSFRLTPLGRQIVAKWEQKGNQLPKPSVVARISNWLNRWLQWSL